MSAIRLSHARIAADGDVDDDNDDDEDNESMVSGCDLSRCGFDSFAGGLLLS